MIPRKLVRNVLTRDGGLCMIGLPGCTRVATAADHRANRGAGGSSILNDSRGLIGACYRCNGLKADAHGDRLEQLRRRGIYVRKLGTNEATLAVLADIPVQDTYGDWWLLRADGTRVGIVDWLAAELIATFVGPVRTVI